MFLQLRRAFASARDAVVVMLNPPLALVGGVMGLWLMGGVLSVVIMGKPGSEIQAPTAIVILFGLLSSTALNMLVVPSLYMRFGGAAREDLRSSSMGFVGDAGRPTRNVQEGE